MTSKEVPRSAKGTATFKARDVEELIDFYVHRRVATWVVRVLSPTRIQPDHVTIASGMVALIAGSVIATASGPWQLVLGTSLFFCSVVLDCCDGQLARLRGTSTFAGRALDGWIDVVSTGAIFMGQFLFMWRQGLTFWLPFGFGWATGYALKWHAHHYDHVKNVYLLNTESEQKGADAYPSLEAIDHEYEAHRVAGRKIASILVKSFRSYTLAQRRAAQSLSDQRRARTEDDRRLYRSVFRLYMRLWTFNGLGTHLFLLMLGTLLATFDSRAPLIIWAVILGPMTLGTALLLGWRRSLEKRYEHARQPVAPPHAA